MANSPRAWNAPMLRAADLSSKRGRRWRSRGCSTPRHESPASKSRRRTERSPASGARDYRAFEGIPYAEPPVGELRWRPPRSPRPWAGVRQAKQPGDECVQQAIFSRPGSAASWHEDCLFLNVYAPTSEPDAKHPVLVWFHGGGWINGAGTDVQPTWLTVKEMSS